MPDDYPGGVSPLGRDPEAALVSLKLKLVRQFLDWMYEEGPDPNAVTRQELYRRYAEHLIPHTPLYISPEGNALAKIVQLAERR